MSGASVKAIREAVGHKPTDLAEMCGISRAHLSNIEAGRKQPSAAIARRLADGLGVPLAAITYPVLGEESA